MSFNILILVLLCVIIAGVINIIYFEKDSFFASINFNRKSVYSNNLEILLDSISI